MTEEQQIQESIVGHRLRNAQLRRSLVDKGVVLSAQRPVDVHFWAETQRDAAILARALYQKGFLLKLIAPAAGPVDEERWTVEAGALIVPDEILGDTFTAAMIRLAAGCGATYDGWATEA